MLFQTNCSALLDAYRSDVSEGTAKLERLQDKLIELEASRAENSKAINEAEQRIQLHKNSTRAEVFRLKGNYLSSRKQDYRTAIINFCR